MNPKLVIRTDTGPKIGYGHYMRCRALAEAWPGEVFFAGDVPNASVKITTADELNDYAGMINADWVVLDGYQFDSVYQKQIQHRLLVIDDYGHAGSYHADFILNQNLEPDPAWYSPATKQLLGSRYVLLRQEFSPWRNPNRFIAEQAGKILVTMGGSDPDNVTWSVMQALTTPATIIIGPANPHRAFLEKNTGIHNIIVDPPDLPRLMASADFVFCAGGTTCWELAFLGTPFMVMALAENQQNNAKKLVQMGIAEKWDLKNIPEKVRREEMSQKGFALIDGLGASRVVQQLLGEKILLRPARAEDSRLLWEWANEPEARAQSFSSESIPWENHQKWFSQKLHDSDCRMYLAFDEKDQSVGQIRFDHSTLSVSLDKNHRGRGLGAEVIRQGARRFFKDTQLPVIDAWVKPTNSASVCAFETCGFTLRGEETLRGHSALHFVLNRKS